tara:strand:+ start:552 stop:1058 length:507 start_codon:yes stop_codon:yes gene_type:complete
MKTLNFKTEMKAIGNALTEQGIKIDATNDSRRSFVIKLQDSGIDLNIVDQADKLKSQIKEVYKNGSGKTADETEKKSIQAIRQAISCFKKSRNVKSEEFPKGTMVSPNNYLTYAEWRKEVYNEAPPTKLEQIQKWLDANEPDITIQDLEKLILEYKACGEEVTQSLAA